MVWKQREIKALTKELSQPARREVGKGLCITVHHCLGAASAAGSSLNPTLKELNLINACAGAGCVSHKAFGKVNSKVVSPCYVVC